MTGIEIALIAAVGGISGTGCILAGVLAYTNIEEIKGFYTWITGRNRRDNIEHVRYFANNRSVNLDNYRPNASMHLSHENPAQFMNFPPHYNAPYLQPPPEYSASNLPPSYEQATVHGTVNPAYDSQISDLPTYEQATGHGTVNPAYENDGVTNLHTSHASVHQRPPTPHPIATQARDEECRSFHENPVYQSESVSNPHTSRVDVYQRPSTPSTAINGDIFVTNVTVEYERGANI